MTSLPESEILINLSTTPHCLGLQVQPSASEERENLKFAFLLNGPLVLSTPLSIHLAHGLAYTVGSALGSIPPSVDTCLTAFVLPNKVQLTAGARAWSKHGHRSLVEAQDDENDSDEAASHRQKGTPGWWGTPSGPVTSINEKASALFWKITNNATGFPTLY
ncbi:hypothetical protein D9757_001546 [Collybiopsis confluens]|uniref:Uncharacterized protein n=1 Tax=Collybiopsis confluens TaxID=2823264 RepID=A0A8H5HZU1_9AGAR|nr:hypothetical protein D9757_001546 [Collybiopsis confluens]